MNTWTLAATWPDCIRLPMPQKVDNVSCWGTHTVPSMALDGFGMCPQSSKQRRLRCVCPTVGPWKQCGLVMLQDTALKIVNQFSMSQEGWIWGTLQEGIKHKWSFVEQMFCEIVIIASIGWLLPFLHCSRALSPPGGVIFHPWETFYSVRQRVRAKMFEKTV